MFKGLVKGLLWALFLALALAGLLRLTVVTTAAVDHAGMVPTLFEGDQLLVARGTPLPGSIAHCEHPSIPNSYVLARVLASGGAQIEVSRGQVQINGKAPFTDWGALEQFQGSGAPTGVAMRRGHEELNGVGHAVYLREGAKLHLPPRTVPKGTLFLMSDNRSYARRDSRAFGPVPEDRCVGTVWFRYRLEQPKVGNPLPWMAFVR